MVNRDWEQLLEKLFPGAALAGRPQLVFVAHRGAVMDGGALKATFRLVFSDWDPTYGWSVSNIKEQEVWLTPSGSDHARIIPYLDAVAEMMDDLNVPLAAMPQDFFSYGGSHPLKLKTPRFQKQFREVLLTKGRLGRWL